MHFLLYSLAQTRVCARVACARGRIGQGKFTLNGKEYHLAINNGPNALHGGLEGFDKKIWDVTVLSESPASIQLDLVSPDGDQGYPGEMKVSVVYTVTEGNSLEITYKASSSEDTVVNLTNHGYFNLAGVALNPSILNTQITMTDDVKGFLELDENALPTGRVLSWSDADHMRFSASIKSFLFFLLASLLNRETNKKRNILGRQGGH